MTLIAPWSLPGALAAVGQRCRSSLSRTTTSMEPCLLPGPKLVLGHASRCSTCLTTTCRAASQVSFAAIHSPGLFTIAGWRVSLSLHVHELSLDLKLKYFMHQILSVSSIQRSSKPAAQLSSAQHVSIHCISHSLKIHLSIIGCMAFRGFNAACSCAQRGCH